MLWAFATSPYGLGLSSEGFWGLCDRSIRPLARQRDLAQRRMAEYVAALRSDLYHTAGKSFNDPPAPADFMSGHLPGVEERAQQLIEMGYSPSEAVALASSRQSSEHKLFVIDQACKMAHAKKRRA